MAQRIRFVYRRVMRPLKWLIRDPVNLVRELSRMAAFRDTLLRTIDEEEPALVHGHTPFRVGMPSSGQPVDEGSHSSTRCGVYGRIRLSLKDVGRKGVSNIDITAGWNRGFSGTQITSSRSVNSFVMKQPDEVWTLRGSPSSRIQSNSRRVAMSCRWNQKPFVTHWNMRSMV